MGGCSSSPSVVVSCFAVPPYLNAEGRVNSGKGSAVHHHHQRRQQQQQQQQQQNLTLMTASTLSPSATASSSLFSTTAPQPSPRPYPSASAENGFERPSLASMPVFGGRGEGGPRRRCFVSGKGKRGRRGGGVGVVGWEHRHVEISSSSHSTRQPPPLGRAQYFGDRRFWCFRVWRTPQRWRLGETLLVKAFPSRDQAFRAKPHAAEIKKATHKGACQPLPWCRARTARGTGGG